MTMMDDERCVVDTNLLIYATVSSSPWNNQARHWLKTLQERNKILCVTTQVLREYLVILTRGQIFSQVFSIDEAVQEIEALLQSLEVIGEIQESSDRLRDIVQRYQVHGKQIHDANLVATMITFGISHLATYNQKDFKRFQEIILESPPSESP